MGKLKKVNVDMLVLVSQNLTREKLASLEKHARLNIVYYSEEIPLAPSERCFHRIFLVTRMNKVKIPIIFLTVLVITAISLPASVDGQVGPISMKYEGFARSKFEDDLTDGVVVDCSDLAIAAWSFGSFPNHRRWNSDADVSGDGVVDGSDLVFVARCPVPKLVLNGFNSYFWVS